MVDEERVTRLLAAVAADVRRLRALSTGDVAQDADRLDAVKYRFVTVIEGCVGVAHHIVVSENWGVPETNADAIRELAAHGVVDPALAESLARAAGFRNVLVHRYVEVDDKAVLANLARLDEIDDYAGAVAAWLESPTDAPQPRR